MTKSTKTKKSNATKEQVYYAHTCNKVNCPGDVDDLDNYDTLKEALNSGRDGGFIYKVTVKPVGTVKTNRVLNTNLKPFSEDSEED